MLFNSLEFGFFFIIVLLLYILVGQRLKMPLLLICSYVFYGFWRVEYLGLILVSTLVDYFCGLKIGKTTNDRSRKFFLSFSVLTNLGILSYFKYSVFFNKSLIDLGAIIGFEVPLFFETVLLPVGISFYTFQTMSYTIDVYRGQKEPEPHFGYFALYVSYFPQLVAGPIERSGHLINELKKTYLFSYTTTVSGLRLMLLGFFKKVVIADRLAIYVDYAYGNSAEISGVSLWIATYFFALQIYCDFSGYSDIAIGVSRMFGIDLMENFKRPYFSKNIQEFWRRWHISLSTWFRDYIYLSMGGGHCSLRFWVRNILVVFILSGLWHGANWTFVIWGLLHGVYYLVYVFSKPILGKLGLQKKISSLIAILINFHMVCLAWVFFRADNLQHAIQILSKIFDFDLGNILYASVFEQSDFIISLLAVSILIGLQINLEKKNLSLDGFLNNLKMGARWACYYFIVLFILIFGVFDKTQFIYFQF